MNFEFVNCSDQLPMTRAIYAIQLLHFEPLVQTCTQNQIN